MARKRHTAEEIINHLRQVEVMVAQGRSVREAIRQIGVTEQTYYRWRKEYGGMDTTQAHRLKELERENQRSSGSWPIRRWTSRSSERPAGQSGEPSTSPRGGRPGV